MKEEKNTEDIKKYDNNCLMFLSPCTKRIIFFCLVVIYRLVIFILLLAYVYNSGDSKSKESNKDNDNDYNLKSSVHYDYDHEDNDKDINNIICSLKGCLRCTGTNTLNECNSCYSGLEPIYEDGKIKECHNPCETGEGDKCLTCHEIYNRCLTCNINYGLNSLGKCDIKYFLEVTYFTNNNNEQIDIVKNKDSIKEMIINDESFTPSNKYTFPNAGENVIHYVIKESTSITNIFENIVTIKKVKFTKFNLYNIDITNDMFNGCTALTSVDMSEYKLTNTISMKNMFFNCESLQSIIFNPVNKLKVDDLQYSFYGCVDLTSLDLSNVILSSNINLN